MYLIRTVTVVISYSHDYNGGGRDYNAEPGS